MSRTLTVFEHGSLHVDRGDVRISTAELKALQQFYGELGVPYFSLVHNGVRFNEYVGVIQVGKCVIEVLPKSDNRHDKSTWRRMLIAMLKAVGAFDIHAPSSSQLQLQSNHILDLYFSLFIRELNYLKRRGLVKMYRSRQGNQMALIGSLMTAKHFGQNAVHKERFFVQDTVYDREHELHAILYKALQLVQRIHTNPELSGPLGALFLDFPEQKDIHISETLFDKIRLNRKTESYRKALEIARLLLLNFHPDVLQGNNNVLALMFDMNVLWEQFVYQSLKKYLPPNNIIAAQHQRKFWKPNLGYSSVMKPDIVINRDQEDCVVLDTKWKNLNGKNPSPEDLRQMFVYMKYYRTDRVALIYPGESQHRVEGRYFDHQASKSGLLSKESCSVIMLPVEMDIFKWQRSIFEGIFKYLR